jgi:hypothetical protein
MKIMSQIYNPRETSTGTHDFAETYKKLSMHKTDYMTKLDPDLKPGGYFASAHLIGLEPLNLYDKSPDLKERFVENKPQTDYSLAATILANYSP